MRDTLKSVVWFFAALVTCPCHLFLLIPLLAGTALGSYFMEFKDVIFIILALLFVFSLYMGWRKLFPETKKEDCCGVKR